MHPLNNLIANNGSHRDENKNQEPKTSLTSCVL